MKPRHVYLILCVLGIALPYSQLVPWLLEHGLNATLFFRELLASQISAFSAMDVIVSAIVIALFHSKRRETFASTSSLVAGDWNIDRRRFSWISAVSLSKAADIGSNKRCSVIEWGIGDAG